MIRRRKYNQRAQEFKCNRCGYKSRLNKFKRRTNYSHGRASRGRTTIFCPKCDKLCNFERNKR